MMPFIQLCEPPALYLSGSRQVCTKKEDVYKKIHITRPTLPLLIEYLISQGLVFIEHRQ